METDAKGQLGGLDTTDQIRKHLAAESLSYLCPACGKTNADIIKDCHEQSESNGILSSGAPEIEVPSELKMGWKDEMSPETTVGKSPDQPAEATPPAQSDTHSGSLRPESNLNRTASAVRATNSRRSPTQNGPAVSMRVGQAQHPSLPPGVPRWLDQLIIFLIVILAAAILHRLMSTAATTV